ncbi:DUF5518 domain-containing protein [Halorubellus sp. JP-L1]|uniref:DUF5518 domain-containing protein n=1 Tax=Halorubellus sp. JP-L1 TaxID=2715753 RepID=UPI00140E2A07|nr:DUF5518 domain-containing protein [Halorubellus sp. JP-L1]NHN40253.1 DUF5518 domain-containing protein [Halorubellus sp. JP-L1]
MSQSHRSDDPLQAIKDITGDSTLLIALAGAAVSILTSFVPFSPVLGGALAGWLVRDDPMQGAKVGGLSGLVISLPLGLIVIPFFGIAIFDGGASGIAFLFIAMFVVFVGLLYTVGISALGGYLGVRFYQSRIVEGSGTRHAETTSHRDDSTTRVDETGHGDDSTARLDDTSHGDDAGDDEWGSDARDDTQGDDTRSDDTQF